MKKSISFISLLLCLPLLICGLFFISNFNLTFNASAEDNQGETVYLANNSGNGVESFSSFVNNYDEEVYVQRNRTANIILVENINLQGITITKTIGTIDNPFQGTFDGKGYTISNYSFENDALGTNTYLGLFGYTNGATIKNVQISGTYSIRINDFNSANTSIGMLVGYAINTKIDKCIINANFNNLSVLTKTGDTTYENTYFKNINFGGIAGSLQDSSITNSILRRPSDRVSLPTISLNSIYSDIAKIGGIVGNLDNSSIIFAVSQTAINVSVLDNYAGKVYVGGVVGYVSQSNSKIINCVTETSLNVPYSGAYVGRIGGYISNPAPAINNISYVYYYNDGTALIDTFGSKGGYSLTNAEANLVSESRTISNFSSGIQSYFTTKSWNVSEGDHWDFVNTWRIVESNINLQAFIDNFALTVEVSNVLEITTNFENNYRYDDTAFFTFKFSSMADEEANANFYRLSSLTLGTTTVANFRYDETTNIYSLSNVTGYERISMAEPQVTDEGVLYTISINGITSNYRGNYAVNISPIEFRGEFTYRLYDEDDNLVSEEIKSECYVYYTNGQNQTSREVIINDLTYNYSATITTRPNTTSYYAFQGWYLVGAGEEGGDLLLSNPENLSRDISITFGQGRFVDDFEVYAKYVSDACNLIFVIDEGVNQVILGSNQYLISETGTSISIFKQLTELRMQLYLESNYVFDAETFMQELNTYTLDDMTVEFCTMVGEGPQNLEDGRTLYEFNLNLANLNDTDFGGGFSITFNTEYDDSGNTTLIWIIVGSVAGGLLLIGLIILIVFLVKRRGVGGGGGKIKRSSFKKGMYY